MRVSPCSCPCCKVAQEDAVNEPEFSATFAAQRGGGSAFRPFARRDRRRAHSARARAGGAARARGAHVWRRHVGEPLPAGPLVRRRRALPVAECQGLYIILYYIILYYTILYYTILYYTIHTRRRRARPIAEWPGPTPTASFR